MPSTAAQMDSSERAFPALARPDRYFPAASVEAARQRVEACLVRGDGPALVIGASGLGKTMLTEVLAQSLRQRLRVVRLSSTQVCTRRAMLQAVLYGLDLPYEVRGEGALRLSLHKALMSNDTHPEGVVLLVDEAQALSALLLEELRELANLARQGTPRVRLALFGGPSLDDLFATPELEAFSQRVAARCYLTGMTYEETCDYARAHVSAVGADPNEVFSQDGLDALFRASDGVPRLLSQVCDRALLTAVAESRETVNAEVVQLAWSDLHQLPAPWYTPDPQGFEQPEAVQEVVETEEAETSMVEFGELTHSIELEPQAESVWNADEALRSLPLEPTEERQLAPAEEPQPAPAEEVAEAAPDTVAAPVEQGAEETRLSEDPFGEHYDEEEIVLDRFACLNTMLHAKSPQVSNSVDPAISAMASTLEAAEEIEEFEEVDSEELCEPTELDEPDDELPATHALPSLRLQAVDDEDAVECEPDLDHAAAPLEADILIIEQDTVELERFARPTAHRREYRQLFAQLRRG